MRQLFAEVPNPRIPYSLSAQHPKLPEICVFPLLLDNCPASHSSISAGVANTASWIQISQPCWLPVGTHLHLRGPQDLSQKEAMQHIQQFKRQEIRQSSSMSICTAKELLGTDTSNEKLMDCFPDAVYLAGKLL